MNDFDLRHLFSTTVDVILSPSTPMSAPVRPGGQDNVGISDTSTVMEAMRFIWPANLVGHAAVSVPVGVDMRGLPVGVQVRMKHET